MVLNSGGMRPNRHDFENLDRQTPGIAIYLLVSRTLWIGGLWFAAVYIWSVAFDIWPTVFLVLALIVGIVLGIPSAIVVASQKSKVRANQMKYASSAMMLPPALFILFAGLILWGIRSVFF
jgi:hypothetical protein